MTELEVLQEILKFLEVGFAVQAVTMAFVCAFFGFYVIMKWSKK